VRTELVWFIVVEPAHQGLSSQLDIDSHFFLLITLVLLPAGHVPVDREALVTSSISKISRPIILSEVLREVISRIRVRISLRRSLVYVSARVCVVWF
jgi:hypothetical protein